MKYRNIKQFPQWVLDFYQSTSITGDARWPSRYDNIAAAMRQRADATAARWEGVGVGAHPYRQCEIDEYMGADEDFYERYPVFCACEGYRPAEWDFLHDSARQDAFSRHGEFYEAKIGKWYFVLGFNFD
jgi:hypothetical protein